MDREAWGWVRVFQTKQNIKLCCTAGLASFMEAVSSREFSESKAKGANSVA